MEIDVDEFLAAYFEIYNVEKYLNNSIRSSFSYANEDNILIYNNFILSKSKYFNEYNNIVSRLLKVKGWVNNYMIKQLEQALDSLQNLDEFRDEFQKYILEMDNNEFNEFNEYLTEKNYEEILLLMKETSLDYFLENGEDNSNMYKIFEASFPFSNYCSYSGNFSDMSDWQNILLSGKMTDLYNNFFEYLIKDIDNVENLDLSVINEIINEKIQGKTLLEIRNMPGIKDEWCYSVILDLCAYGYGNCKIEELVTGNNDKNYGYSAFVLSDKQGDYNIVYNGTQKNIADFSYDGMTYASYLTSNCDSPGFKSLLNTLAKVSPMFINLFDNGEKADEYSNKLYFDADSFQFTTQEYIDLSIKLTEKYAQKAKDNSKKIHLNGYSLGGSLTEISALWLLDNNYEEYMGEITLLNGLNADLSDQDFEKLKALGQDKFHVYINQGDLVSKFVKEEALEDYAKYIAVPWKNIIDDGKAQMAASNSTIDIYNNYFDVGIDTILGEEGTLLKSFLKDGLKYIALPLDSGAHRYQISIDESATINYDEYGNLICENGEGKTTGSEVSTYITGYDVNQVIKTTIESKNFDKFCKYLDEGIKSLIKTKNLYNDTKNNWNKNSWWKNVRNTCATLGSGCDTILPILIEYHPELLDELSGELFSKSLNSSNDKMKDTIKHWNDRSWWENLGAIADTGTLYIGTGVSGLFSFGTGMYKGGVEMLEDMFSIF